jgi:hypothetical protein
MAIRFVYTPREGEAAEVGYIGPQINANGALLQPARLVEICLGAERIFDADVPFDVIEGSELHTFVRHTPCFRRIGASAPTASSPVIDDDDPEEETEVFADAVGRGTPGGALARHERGMRRR